MKKTSLLGPLSLFIAWALVYWTGWVNPLLLPSPVGVFRSLVSGLVSGALLNDLLATMYRAFFGIALAAVFGIPVGTLLGVNERFHEALGPTVDFFRSIPATAMLPLFMVMFGIGDQTRVLLVFFSASLIMIVNTYSGVRNVSKTRLTAARLMGANRWQLLSKVAVMDALPQVFTGLRVSVSLALIIVVVTEMLIGTTAGLGHRIYDAQLIFNTVEMFSAIILTGLLGATLNLVLAGVERRYLHWAGR